MSSTPKKEDVEKAIAPMAEHASILLAELDDYTITTDRQAKQAGQVMVETKRLIKELEGERTSVTKPLLEIKRKVDSWFLPTVRDLEKGEKALKAKLAAFLDTKAEKATAALAAGDTTVVEEPDLGEGVSVRKKVTAVLSDFDAVPEEFLLPPAERVDWRKVKAAIDAGEDVPGISRKIEHSVAGRVK